jgi:hypothetical protein
MLIVKSIFSEVKVKSKNFDLILIEGGKEGEKTCSVFFKDEKSMEEALDALSEDLKLFPEKKQIVLKRSEGITILTLRKIFDIGEIAFAS